ncbi:MAG: hypothetical protein JNL65_02525 [Saprospiraceae bacterium]|nr:hypothetical protein [Saprospiraceae bacterium]
MITKKRIRKLRKNIRNELFETEILPSVILNEKSNKNLILSLGFTRSMEIGESLLPASIGPVSKFNSEGKGIPDKSKPKETAYREIEWCWEQWAGQGRSERVCQNKLVPYKRWPRIFIEPPSIEIVITKKEHGNIYISTPPILASIENEIQVVHQINLLLELFSHCHILTNDLVPALIPNKRLNWNIFPPGKRPWSEQKALLRPLLESIKESRIIPVIESRLEDINHLDPDFTACGTNGFHGYIVFGFTSKNIFILESALYGNAIYVFNNNWEALSKLTKAEILRNNAQIERITHNGKRANWLDRIRKLLNNISNYISLYLIFNSLHIFFYLDQ